MGARAPLQFVGQAVTDILERVRLGLARKLPLLLQTEVAECGLACVGMVAGFYGYNADMGALRRRFPVSIKGVTLPTMIGVANQLGLVSRPLKLDVPQLSRLRLPCVLHWEFNHFVVLKHVNRGSITIHDPAFGERHLSMDAVNKSFTGVALELWPGSEFRAGEMRARVRLRDLVGQISGLGRAFGQIVVLGIALEIFMIVTPLFQQWVVDDVIVSADLSLLTTLALGFGLLKLIQTAVEAIRGWVLIYMSTMLNIQWRASVFTRMLQLPVEYFQKRHLGDVVSRFGSIDTIQRTLTTSFLEAVLDGLMTVVTLGLMFVYSLQLTMIALLAMALYGIGRWAWFGPLRQATHEAIVFTAKRDSHFFETVRGIRAIKLFQRQDERRSTWLTLLIDQVNADLRSQKLNLFYKSLNGVLFGLENVIVIWLGARLVIKGDFTVGMLIAFLAYKMQFVARVSSLIDKAVSVQMLQIQGERLADMVLTEPERQHVAAAQDWTKELAATLELTNLKFRYAEQDPYVLDDISFKIEERESVAIVGPSGCGKSTLLNILLGILEPSEGSVLVGGVRVEHLGLDALRGMIGTVLQDDVLFAGSLADNISFFDSNVDRSWLEQCAKLASIHDEIEVMPMGYGTLVGDMGTVLSGGQKQRVLLARALYKRPKILFLDEATSALDVDREHLVNAAIKSLQLTTVLVAHRPETIASADRVIRLTAGKITPDTRSAHA
jgi:ATP-binding cassette, subfamily B, bacterial CvaB/MchF/RaxB